MRHSDLVAFASVLSTSHLNITLDRALSQKNGAYARGEGEGWVLLKVTPGETMVCIEKTALQTGEGVDVYYHVSERLVDRSQHLAGPGLATADDVYYSTAMMPQPSDDDEANAVCMPMPRGRYFLFCVECGKHQECFQLPVGRG